jgi:hypothetical protein
MPAHWTDLERGQYLNLLLHLKGIDSNRLYWVEYHPQHHCWLVTQQNSGEGGSVTSEPSFFDHSAEKLCLQTLTEFRRTARLAWSALAARSPETARNGGKYQLPDKPEELTPADLVGLLHRPGEPKPAVQFDTEGGWQTPSSEN